MRWGKRWIALVAAAVIFAGFLYGSGRYGGGRVTAGPWRERLVQGSGTRKIAVVNITGELVSGSTGGFLGSAEAASDDLVSQLEQARKDKGVKAVILQLNTPGGSVVGSDVVLREIRRVRAARKPIVASMGEVAASGGYFIASGATRIVANPSTITGSIGVIMILLNLKGTAGKLGVKPVVIKAGRLKDIGSPFRRMTAEERRIFQTLLNEAHDRFIGVVAQGRQMPVTQVRRIATGRIYSGEQAQRLGLVDQLGDFDDAVSAAKNLGRVDQARVVEYERSFSFGQFFSGVARIPNPREELERSLGVTGPRLAYLYLP
jgi:protease IV